MSCLIHGFRWQGLIRVDSTVVLTLPALLVICFWRGSIRIVASRLALLFDTLRSIQMPVEDASPLLRAFPAGHALGGPSYALDGFCAPSIVGFLERRYLIDRHGRRAA